MNKPSNFSAQEWVTKARIDIMRDPVFCAFCAVLSCGDLTLDTGIPTACTDGWNIRINPTFAAGLPLPELRFVLIHEGMHIAFQHLHVWRSLWERDAQGTNIAADMFINLAIVQADAGRGFVRMPSIGVQPDTQYTDLSVQQIYDRMKQNPPPQDGQGGDGRSGMDDHDWEGAAQPGTKEQAERAESVAQAVRQGEIVRQRSNRGAGDAAGVFSDLLSPKVDWKAALRAFITDLCAGRDESTWRKPNRRYVGDGMLMPSMISHQVGEIVIGFDTSGSCFDTSVMTRFVSEVRALIEETTPDRVHVVYADTQVAGHQVFDNGQFEVANLKPKGGGGTDLTCMFDWVRTAKVTPVAMVILTDGDTPYGTAPGYPVLWAMTETRNRATHGTTIYLQ